MNSSKMIRVSDVISVEDIQGWENDLITIKAGTGTGKSYFIKTRLFLHAKEHNKKILMLVHRRNCFDQFQYEIEKENKTDVIKLSTYQSIEARVKRGETFKFDKYDYIVCDEFHYFMSDAAFNIYTDLSLKEILKQKNKTKILMSATGDHVNRYLEEVKEIEPIKYGIPIKYNFIKDLKFFYQKTVFDDLIKRFIKEKKKAIFFVQSVKQAYELHRKYKNYTMFNCSPHNDDYYKYVSKQKVREMLINEKFEEQILITTTVMDAGVNIIDDELNNIVVDINDTGTLIQCIGRKRLKNNKDYIDLFVRAKTNKQLGGSKKHMLERLERANFVREYGAELYAEAYFRDTNDYSNIIYDNPIGGGIDKEINEMIYFKTRVDLTEINKMLKKDYGYCKYIAWILGRFDPHTKKYNYDIEEEEKDIETLESCMKEIEDKWLFKVEQEELKEVFKNNGLHARSLGINTLNGYLKDKKINFTIVRDRDRRRLLNSGELNPNRNKTYWKVTRGSL